MIYWSVRASQETYPIIATSLLSPLGCGVENHRHHLRNGITGLQPTDSRDPVTTFRGVVETPLPNLPGSLSRHETRATRMTALLFEEIRPHVEAALERWGPSRIGVFLGSCNAGTAGTEDALQYHLNGSPLPTGFDFHNQHHFYGMLHVLRSLSGCSGPGSVISTACSASGKVFATAQRLLNAYVIDAAIVGGIDTLCHLTLNGFNGLGLIAEQMCQPFGQDRAGLNLGEGGALMLLERSGESATALVSIGESSDAHHMTAPSPGGAGAVTAIRTALSRANLSADEIGFIQAHGTSTRANDAAESAAILEVFSPQTPVVATKSYTGHLLGACGGLEAAFTSMSLGEGWLPDSLLKGEVDIKTPVNLTRRFQEFSGKYAISNSFGFGGSNVSLILERSN